MTIKFDKPMGSHADCNELEYIATLHQACTASRLDASVTAEDVAIFLLSRHGITVELPYIEKHLMPTLVGAMDDSPDTIFDIVELTSMLLIPHLNKVGADDDNAQELFGKVVNMIVTDVTSGENGDSLEPVVLNRELMRDILEFYGEGDVAQEIIEEMLRAAGVADGEETTPFDYQALLYATTSDTQKYNLEWEQSITTHYHDILDGTQFEKDMDADSKHFDEEETATGASQLDEAGNQVKRIFSMPSVDYVAENYRSKSFIVMLWLLVIISFFVYAFQFQTALGSQDCNAKFKSEFGCRIVNSIISWLLIFAQLTILGSIFVILTSAGNSIYLQHDWKSVGYILVGFISLFVFCILSYIFEVEFLLINTFKNEETEEFRFAYISVVLLGCILILFKLKALLFAFLPRSVWEKTLFRNYMFKSGMAHAEQCTKQAAAFKTNRMVSNALGHHQGARIESTRVKITARSSTKAGTSSFGIALLNFQATSHLREPAGGVVSAFRSMWNGSLFNEEGVWIHSRLYATNLTQWFLAIFHILAIAVTGRTIGGLYKERRLQQEEDSDTLEYLTPKESTVVAAFVVGGWFAFLAVTGLATIWLPSAVSTIQQFRYGVIPSLHDKEFQILRGNPDQTTVLLGSAFWGSLYSAGIIFTIFGGITFISLWEPTRGVALNVMANVVGIMVISATKLIVLRLFRKTLFVGFFRKKPAGGNFFMLLLECWSLGLTVGTMVVRMVKIILIGAFFVGRLDTPLFAQGVGNIGPVRLDSHPIQFRKDLLLHDSHRHPYMERLAVIYLLKLRYGDDFATRAGGAWRLLFVMALMPWLRRYRLDDGPEGGEDIKANKRTSAEGETAIEEPKDDVQEEASRTEDSNDGTSKTEVSDVHQVPSEKSNHTLVEGESTIEDVKGDVQEILLPMEDSTGRTVSEATDVHPPVLSKREEEKRKLQNYIRKLEGKLHELGHVFEIDDEFKEDIIDQIFNPV